MSDFSAAVHPSQHTARLAELLQLRLSQQLPWLNAQQLFDAEHVIQGLSNPSAKALLISTLFHQQQRPLVIISPDAHACHRLHTDLLELINPSDVMLWPAEEFSPYDLSLPPMSTIQQQFAIGNALNNGDRKLFLLPAKSLVLKHLSLERQQQLALTLKLNQTISPQQVVQQLQYRGYRSTPIVLEPGEFSLRGDILDIYPVQQDAVRIGFFGDEIESIKVMDIESQRSISTTKQVQMVPLHPILTTPENLELLKEKLYACYDKQAKTLNDVEADALHATLKSQLDSLNDETHLFPDGFDYYAALLGEVFETAVSLIPQSTPVIIDDWQQLDNELSGYVDRLNRQLHEGIAKGRLLDIGFEYHYQIEEALGALKQTHPKRLVLSPFELILEDNTQQSRNVELELPPAFKADMQALATHLQQWRKGSQQIIISTENPQRVLDNCKEWDVAAVYLAPNSKELPAITTGDVLITKDGLAEGFIWPEINLVYLTDAELFNRKRKRAGVMATSARKRDDADVVKSIDELREGDFVVHYKHGIGQFEKLNAITIDGETKEYLTLRYAGQDRLHVPVDQVNLLSRYRGSGEAPPKLNKMGGIDWGKTKTKAQKSIQSIARELIELYAAREKVRGHQFEPDTPWQVELEEAFPFTETPDQWQAIMDVKTDMESDKPMDRLICGDVGFGKTEVAIRGIFKAVLSGKQVAVLVPTTILAQQHFNTIADRFKAFPVKVGLMSRFRTPKEQKELLGRLAIGECDVVVGTHRLLQKDVQFKDLGIVVVDEEHRFGVSHKEKLKQMRKNVDFLTMSATPIPRTLHMALSGIRTMSLINTAPVNRSPIKTFVGPYNPAQVRMAILQEVDRGGQVYFLHNRVQSIYQMQQHLEELVPEVKVGVAHGQMDENSLENAMLAFAQGEYDVLLCTTIIESGLDIPRANTMIMDKADRFGLAQLYQIRGRVGRSDVQAYCYCYYEQDRVLSQDAQGRLRAIREFTQLGSGYQVALRDMEIRGVGNVLGGEQHGHMVAVGFDLYCDMLKETIDALQGKLIEQHQDAVIDLNVTAFIPDEWMMDKNLKLTEYKRLADIRNMRSLDIIISEWEDRFGALPEPTLKLTQLVRIRIMATDLGITNVREDDEFVRINVPYNLQQWLTMQAKLPAEIGRQPRWLPATTGKTGSQPMLTIKQLSIRSFDKLDYLERLLKEIAKLNSEATPDKK